ncbi:hypothetical protein RKD20_006294 [Streptomyces sp. SLBN-8D4]
MPAPDAHADGEGGGGQPCVHRRPAEALLEEERPDEEESADRDPEQEPHRHADGERAGAEHPELDQRGADLGEAALLVGEEDREQHQGAGDHAVGPGRPAQAAALGERVDEQRHGGEGQWHAEQVELGALRGAGLADHQGAGDQRRDPDGDVDQEDRAPFPAEEVPLHDHAAEGEAEDRGGAGDRAEHGDRLAPLARREDHVQDRQDLGDHQAGRGALDEPGHDQHFRVDRDTAQQRGDGEGGHAGQEDTLASEDVTEPAAEDQQGGEGEHVRRDDPLDLGVVGVQVALDARDGDVDDRRVDQVHESGDQDDGEGQAALRVGCGATRGFLRRGGGSRCGDVLGHEASMHF